jgi:hypothetical protein
MYKVQLYSFSLSTTHGEAVRLSYNCVRSLIVVVSSPNTLLF